MPEKLLFGLLGLLHFVRLAHYDPALRYVRIGPFRIADATLYALSQGAWPNRWRWVRAHHATELAWQARSEGYRAGWRGFYLSALRELRHHRG